MMKKTLLFDLDETLISTSFRQYMVIKNYLKNKLNIDCDDFNNYLELRKVKMISNFEYFKLNFQEDTYDIDFRDYYLKNIELSYYLKYDQLIVDIEKLKSLIEMNFSLILISLRKNTNESTKQITKLGLFDFFDEIHFTKHNKDKNPKTPIIKKIINNVNTNLIGFVGDSISDYNATKDFKIPFYLVKTGIYDININNCHSFSSINHFISKLKNNERI